MNAQLPTPHGPLPRRLPMPRLAGLLAALLIAILAGCGPTGGGTGTGEGAVVLAGFGAAPASACTAPFAAALSCTADTSAVDAGLLAGTGRVLFAGLGVDAHLGLVLDGNRAEFESRCTGTRFAGYWGRLPGGETRYFGSDRGVPAQLVLQAQSGREDALWLWLLDGSGRIVLGPVQVQRVAALPADPACP